MNSAHNNIGIKSNTNEPLFLLAACQENMFSGLVSVKAYIAECKKFHQPKKSNFPLLHLLPLDSLTIALKEAVANPADCIVLACGFETKQIRAMQQQLDPDNTITIISQPGNQTERYHVATASLLEDRLITRVRALDDAVRKSVLKRSAGRLGEVRMIRSQDELAKYFALRFKVWHEMGYLKADYALLQEQWEVDQFDRSSLPIGLFDHNGELLACARLVQQYGLENAHYVAEISKLFNKHHKPEAKGAFSFSGTVEQPFDILCEFRGFREYYRNFVEQHLSVAEVSRIMVKPEYRGYGLGEVLVDSLVSVSAVQDIDVLLLACRESLQPLYQHCGFTAVKDLVSDQFLTIPERSVVMKRQLA